MSVYTASRCLCSTTNIYCNSYGMRVWIEALLDNEAVVPSDHRKRNITPPPPYFKPTESDAGSVSSSTAPPSAAARRRSTRSASPSKRLGTSTPRKTRASKAKDSPLKKEVAPATIAEDDEEEEVTLTATETTTTLTTTETIPVLTNGNIPSSGVSLTTPVKSDPIIRVEVDEEIETNGDVEVRTTHVMVELPADGEIPTPENTENMIAKAREMVAEAYKTDLTSDMPTPGKKRKAEDIATADDEDEDEGDVEDVDTKRVKKSKIEEELKREKVKNRALIGLSTVLAIG